MIGSGVSRAAGLSAFCCGIEDTAERLRSSSQGDYGSPGPRNSGSKERRAFPRNGIALAAGSAASARILCQVLQVAPFSVKLVGAALLLVQVPWMPSVTEPPAGMEPL